MAGPGRPGHARAASGPPTPAPTGCAPTPSASGRRKVTDAEVITLAVAQALMGIPSDRRFLAVARRRLAHLFPRLPGQSGYHKRRRRRGDAFDWLCGVFASACPGFHDDLVLLDSTPVECGRSPETARRSRLAECSGDGWSQSHWRFFWGMRLHLVCALDGTPRGARLVSAERAERDVALELLPRCLRGGEVVCDKGDAGSGFREAVAGVGAQVVRPRRQDEPGHGPFLGLIRQRIESVFQTLKDLLTLERHGARTPEGLRERIGYRLLALAACVWLNYRLGRATRALVDFVA